MSRAHGHDNPSMRRALWEGERSGALKVGFSQLHVNEERKNASVGQSDWFLCVCTPSYVQNKVM